MGFGSRYTFEELARTLRTTAPAQLTLSAGQLLDLIEENEKDIGPEMQGMYGAGYDTGYQDGIDACEANHPKTAA